MWQHWFAKCARFTYLKCASCHINASDRQVGYQDPVWVIWDREIMRDIIGGPLSLVPRDMCLPCVLWFCIWPTTTTTCSIMNLHSIFDFPKYQLLLNVGVLVQIQVEADGVLSAPFRCLVGKRTASQLYWSLFTLPSVCLCVFSLFDFLLSHFVTLNMHSA